MKSFLSPSKHSPELVSGYVHSLRDVRKRWMAGGRGFELVVPHLDIRRGERIAVVGVSGCGKSTLLDLLAMTLKPSQSAHFSFQPTEDRAVDLDVLWRRGEVDRLAQLRRRYLGYVLQTGGLLPYLKVGDNIGLSRRLLGLAEDGTVEALASTLGIGDHLNKLPGQLSVGERQRVAIARAIAHRPVVVLADEPTASVDPTAAQAIMDLFLYLAEQFEITSVVATHDRARIDSLGFRSLQHELEGGQGEAITISRFRG